MSGAPYLLAPESMAELGSGQEFETVEGRMPRAITPITMEFEANYGGPVVQAFTHFGILPEVARVWREGGVTGFTTAEMVCRPSPEALTDTPDFEPPQYDQLILTQNDTQDVYKDPQRNYIRLSERAKVLLEQFDLGWCAILPAE